MAGAGRRISVAIASYNGAPYIGEQLASIAGQTLLPNEVVISDDGSRDETCAIAEAFARTAPFALRVIRQPAQLGIFRNFLAALTACDGDYIAYCDQDDVWLPEKLARQVAVLEAGAMLAVHPSRVVDARLNPLGRDEPLNFMHGTLAAPVDAGQVRVFAHQMLLRRAVLDLMLAVEPIARALYPTGFARNFDDLIPFCASLLGGVTVMAEPLVLFRRHATSTSGAGVTTETSLGLRARAAIAIARDLARAEERFATAEAVIAERLLTPSAHRVVKALERRVAALRKLSRMANRTSRAGRLFALLAVLPALLVPTGFTNRRPLHEVTLALIAAAA